MKFFSTLLGLAFLLGAGAAGAADTGFGPRLGLTHDGDYDQVHLGGQAVIRDLRPNLEVRPSLEIGTGDGLTVVAFNGDVVYEFTELATRAWGLYGGAGLALNFFDADRGGDSTDFGLNLVTGVVWKVLGDRRSLFGEVRLGIEDSPDLKATVGLNFF